MTCIRRSLIRNICNELSTEGKKLDLVRILTILIDPVFGNIGINIGTNTWRHRCSTKRALTQDEKDERAHIKKMLLNDGGDVRPTQSFLQQSPAKKVYRGPGRRSSMA